MIKIQCSVLEQVRKNPVLHGQILASNITLGRGGTHGMLAYWQDVSLNLHKQEYDFARGIKELQKTFFNFEETVKNYKKQDFLQDSFVKYHKNFNKRKFELVETRKRINWNISSVGLLTGLTPWVFKANNKFYSYLFTEREYSWNTELRFPLIQSYLAYKILECDISVVNIGIYSLSTDNFFFKNFSQPEINGAIDETVDIFKKVNTEYEKIKL
jgi:hypothetical protein